MSGLRVSHIVAAGENQVIGNQGKLPWHIPEDLRFFREKTKGHAMIMGRKTWESLGKALPNRLNVVITRQKNYTAHGAVVAPDIKAALSICEHETATWGDEVFIIGGGEVYRESLPFTDVVYLTRVHLDPAGDATYPALPENEFVEIERREGPGCTFFTYARNPKLRRAKA